MNAIVSTTGDDNALVQVMRDALYPGAKEDSVRLVLSYCRARGYDPMRKPVHIVPMYVGGGYRDVPMPGITAYRIDAARTGEYDGKTEPEFGPDVTRSFEGEDKNGRRIAKTVTFPSWCKMTVFRRGKPFTATEFWAENYATMGKADVPNEMWAKRPYGQLAKCAEAQALRMAFPEETGGQPTAEEMEGKSHGAEPMREVPNLAPAPAPRVVEDAPEFPFLTMGGKEVMLTADKWRASLAKALASLHDADTLAEWRAERGGLLARIYEAGAEELVADAERAIDMRAAELAEARA